MMSDVPAVSDFLQSFYGKCNAESEHHFHQIVGNRYDKTMNQAIPWHSDESALLSSNTDIVSVSLGCGGVFCYMPKQKAPGFYRSLQLGGQWHKRRQAAIDGHLRGCVPLFAGDVLLMCGSFQECMQHITLPFRSSGRACAEAVRVPSIVGDVMAQYPGTTLKQWSKVYRRTARIEVCSRSAVSLTTTTGPVVRRVVRLYLLPAHLGRPRYSQLRRRHVCQEQVRLNTSRPCLVRQRQ